MSAEQQIARDAMNIGLLMGLRHAAELVARSNLPTSSSYEAARDVWRRWWQHKGLLEADGWRIP